MKMVKMLEIRKAIFTQIRNVTDAAYYQDAPENTPTPFVTVDISNSIDDGTLERFVMDIDGWGASNNTTALETIMDGVDKQLHRKTIYITDGAGRQLGVTFYREQRLTFDETDKRIFRRRYIYQIRTHEK
jgi:predicted metal-dependent peptidase